MILLSHQFLVPCIVLELVVLCCNDIFFALRCLLYYQRIELTSLIRALLWAVEDFYFWKSKYRIFAEICLVAASNISRLIILFPNTLPSSDFSFQTRNNRKHSRFFQRTTLDTGFPYFIELRMFHVCRRNVNLMPINRVATISFSMHPDIIIPSHYFLVTSDSVWQN